MEIATQGRTVVGRIELGQGLADIVDLKSLDGSFGRGLDIDGVDLANRPWVPAEFDTADQRAKWYHDYYNNTENGRQRQLAITRTRSVMIHSDGSFVSEMVEPGKYVFSGNLFRDGRIIALLELHFVVPPDRAEIEDAVPLDVGKAILTPVIKLKAGDLAPDFTVPSLDGQTIKLSDYAGKYVLLDFWATWCGPCVAETPNLKSTFDAFGADKRFAMVSLSCDFDRSAPAKYVKANGISWAQAFLDHNGGKDVVNNYGVTSIPQILLIGPDRKIIACDLRGSKIKSVVATALGNR